MPRRTRKQTPTEPAKASPPPSDAMAAEVFGGDERSAAVAAVLVDAAGQPIATPVPAAVPAVRSFAAGPQCRRCGCRHLPVHHTRRVRDMLVRVRYCRNCGTRMLTREREG